MAKQKSAAAPVIKVNPARSAPKKRKKRKNPSKPPKRRRARRKNPTHKWGAALLDTFLGMGAGSTMFALDYGLSYAGLPNLAAAGVHFGVGLLGGAVGSKYANRGLGGGIAGGAGLLVTGRLINYFSQPKPTSTSSEEAGRVYQMADGTSRMRMTGANGVRDAGRVYRMAEGVEAGGVEAGARFDTGPRQLPAPRLPEAGQTYYTPQVLRRYGPRSFAYMKRMMESGQVVSAHDRRR